MFFPRLHGWKYLDSEESNFSKCFWIFIIFVALVAAAFLLYTNTDEFSNVSVVTRQDILFELSLKVFVVTSQINLRHI